MFPTANLINPVLNLPKTANNRSMSRLKSESISRPVGFNERWGRLMISVIDVRSADFILGLGQRRLTFQALMVTRKI